MLHLTRALSGLSPLQQGLAIALATALLSGVSVYINATAVRALPDPFVFAGAKNLVVAVMLAATVGFSGSRRELPALTGRRWGQLALLGLVGGSVPFLLFFYGLSLSSAPSAAFIHKTLFLWVALLAIPLLGERFGRAQLMATAALAGGNLVLLGWPARWAVTPAELCTLAATLLWAFEAVVARRVLAGISPSLGALGRMGFGGFAVFAFLGATGRMDVVAALTPLQWGWIGVTAVLLFGYVLGYYHALKLAPASSVTAILVAGSVVTAGLYAVVDARSYGLVELLGLGLVAAAAAVMVWVAPRMALGAPWLKGGGA
ncbi:MAG: DMT family transporter [Chloroflexota bacterium]